MASDYIELNEIVGVHIHATLMNLCSGSEAVFCAILGLASFFCVSLNMELKGQLELT